MSPEQVTHLTIVLLVALGGIVVFAIIMGVFKRTINAYKASKRALVRRFDKQEFLIKSLCLRVNFPIVLDTGWSIAYDLANLILDEIILRPSSVILEVGSGMSTVIWAACVRGNKNSRILSVENEPVFYEHTKQLLCHYGVSSQNVELALAPYKEYVLGADAWKWYDLDALRDLRQQIDIFIIDGPPSTLQPLSRYPALPLIWERLGQDCVVIMDDGARQEEKEIVRLWLKDYPDLKAYFVATEKGTWILRRKDAQAYRYKREVGAPVIPKHGRKGFGH